MSDHTNVIRVQLVDDHAIVRSGFCQLLDNEHDITVVAESETGKQACRDYAQALPDVLILDITLPDITGLEVMRRILYDHPDARILILSMHTGMVAKHATRQGAMAYVSKASSAATLISALHMVMQGKHYMDQQADIPVTPDADPDRAPAQSLTKRELEVCLHLSRGCSVSEIAELLHLSDKTVYTHRHRIMGKLGVSTPIELMQAAARMGITFFI